MGHVPVDPVARRPGRRDEQGDRGADPVVQSSTRAGQLTQVDIATFIQWVDADVKNDEKLARFYRKRFRPEFPPAFAAWIATKPKTNPKAPLTPFAMPQYRLATAKEASG